MAKIKVGDVFSILTKKGKVYLHYLRAEKGKECIKVLDGFFTKDCNDLENLVKAPERFFIGFPVAAAYRRKIIVLEGFVPANDYELPKYTRTPSSILGVFQGWYIIDEQSWVRTLVDDLTPEQLKLSPRGSVNDTLLVEWLETDFSLEKWTTEYILSNLKEAALNGKKD
ncbi:hypothetical protein GCM10009007_21120 [Formosimonas limnophila]|uniref:Immunity protein 26 n=1 Tax=Formosimonas limnophila TaxID=1384487 RepID=A0A8J3CNT2_9BURK|nr:hypothetical protein [Formosimonas limnophila]GHA80224.1 hypothetical protein GCM10009007_21120 [Formosimonas limnophila]